MEDTTPASSGTATTEGADAGADEATDESMLLPTVLVTRIVGAVPVFALRRSKLPLVDGWLDPLSRSGKLSLPIASRITATGVSGGAGVGGRESVMSAIGN